MVNWSMEFLPYARFPVILPRHSRVTRLIIRPYEEDNHSAGTNNLLSVLWRRFWVIAGREVIKECTNNYMICKESKVAPASQLMVPHPQIRIKFNIRAFSIVGVDFARPFLTIHGWEKTRNKRYLSLCTKRKLTVQRTKRVCGRYLFLSYFFWIKLWCRYSK